jgi:hypothetical protein
LPWWLRLALFAVLAAPLVNMHLVTQWASDSPIARVAAMMAYAVAIWLIIIVLAGLEKFVAYTSPAAIMLVATVVVGPAVNNLLGYGGDTRAESDMLSEHNVRVALMLLTSLPFAFLVIQSFSASRLLEHLSKRAGTSSYRQMTFAVWLRVFQHLTETFPALLIVWKEENPSLLLPRHKDDWRTQNFLKKAVSLGDWVISAALSWAKCLLMFSLRIVPAVNIETARLAQHQK